MSLSRPTVYLKSLDIYALFLNICQTSLIIMFEISRDDCLMHILLSGKKNQRLDKEIELETKALCIALHLSLVTTLSHNNNKNTCMHAVVDPQFAQFSDLCSIILRPGPTVTKIFESLNSVLNSNPCIFEVNTQT